MSALGVGQRRKLVDTHPLRERVGDKYAPSPVLDA